ncbi:MAG: SO_0444 family Cu/Zn efflux transporter [Deltaproteobacteria bacterium]|nr:SO_0444 family Cu/Zn efflux transporter [Deltaproteobacteria bacterium]
MTFVINVFLEAWHLLLESSLYVIFGLLVSGLLRVFLNPSTVSRQLGQGKFKSVFKAAFLGIPLPLCSCGVLPAAVALRKQGANTGATTAFLISTPESGVDSLAITYALLDPVMTVARPIAAFTTATVAGIAENTFNASENERSVSADLTCPVDACCDGKNCPPEEHKKHHTSTQKIKAGLKYALTDVWGDMAGWFLSGILLAGLITTLVPDEMLVRYLGGGLPSMLLMLAVGIPLYICATASTPVAAALILKGVSPGAALVFLLAGPATNVTSLTVLWGALGKRATVIYLTTICLSAVFFGLMVDHIYRFFGFHPQALLGQAAEIMPVWGEWAGALFLMALSIKPLYSSLSSRFKMDEDHPKTETNPDAASGISTTCTTPT